MSNIFNIRLSEDQVETIIKSLSDDLADTLKQLSINIDVSKKYAEKRAECERVRKDYKYMYETLMGSLRKIREKSNNKKGIDEIMRNMTRIYVKDIKNVF